MRYLGIDYGTKKIGLALSDENGQMGFPHSILPNSPKLESELCALIAKENVGAVVIGESRNFTGADNKIVKAARILGTNLGGQAGVPVYFEDETLTSAEARRMRTPTEKTRKPAQHGNIDASAAALILTSYLSRQNHG
jgi:putative holliday junction resolvase